MNKTVLGMIAVSAMLTGCASLERMTGNGMDHFYEGEKLPMTQLSVIEFNGESGWGRGSGVDVEAINDKPLPTFSQSKIALKPGKYTIKYECDANQNMMDGVRVGLTTTTIELEAGVHYLLVGDVSALPPSQWYYSEQTFLGQVQRRLEKNSCALRPIKHKALTNEG